MTCKLKCRICMDSRGAATTLLTAFRMDKDRLTGGQAQRNGESVPLSGGRAVRIDRVCTWSIADGALHRGRGGQRSAGDEPFAPRVDRRIEPLQGSRTEEAQVIG